MLSAERIKQLVNNEADTAFRRRVRTVFEWLEPQDGDHILDCGCGRGFYLKYLQQVNGCQITGLEYEYRFLKMAQMALNARHDEDVGLVHGDVYSLPFPDNTFDKIIMSEVLEHLDDDEVGLPEVVRVLKPGGLIAITVPNQNYPFWWDPLNKTLERLFDTHIQSGLLAGIWANHTRLYSAEQLRRVALEAGLEVMAERAFTHYCMPFTHNIIYGFGKTILESGMLPDSMAAVADRHRMGQHRASFLNPVRIGISVLDFFDRPNVMDEPAGRSTVNLCLKGRKPDA